MARFKIRLYRQIPYAICALENAAFKLSTGLKIPDSQWDHENHRIKKNCPYRAQYQEVIDSKLSQLINVVKQIEVSGDSLTPSTIRHYLDGRKEEKLPEFLNYFDQYLELKRSRIAYGTYKNIKHTVSSLREFQKYNKVRISEKNLDQVMIAKYIRFQLEVKGYRDSTIQKHIKKLREFMKWAYPEISINHIKYSLRPVYDPIFLTQEELEILKSAVLHNHTMQKVRDLFLFLCTTGMRFSDSQRFTKDWIQNGLIQYRMIKTGGRAYVPLRETTSKIVDLWGGKAPRISQQKFNDYLKILFKRLEFTREVTCTHHVAGRLKEELFPLDEVISSHVGRKTYITQSLLNGIPIQDVMKTSGHSDYQSMKPYIAITNQHLKEVALRWEI